MSKINIYINSKNRKSDESPSNFSAIIPDDLLKINKDEYFTISVNSFYCYNDFIIVMKTAMDLILLLEII